MKSRRSFIGARWGIILGISLAGLCLALIKSTENPKEQPSESNLASPSNSPNDVRSSPPVTRSSPPPDISGAAPQTASATGVNLPTKLARPVHQRIAQSGYGDFIGRALYSSDPALKFEATKLLKECLKANETVERDRANATQNAGPGRNNSAFLYALSQSEQIQRNCQTITPSQYQNYLPLLETAAQGSALGAASEYYMKIPPAKALTTPWLTTGLQRDADRGDVAAMRIMACDSIGAALPNIQRNTYLSALQTLSTGANPVNFHAALMLRYCGARSDSTAPINSEELQRLVVAAMAADDEVRN